MLDFARGHSTTQTVNRNEGFTLEHTPLSSHFLILQAAKHLAKISRAFILLWKGCRASWVGGYVRSMINKVVYAVSIVFLISQVSQARVQQTGIVTPDRVLAAAGQHFEKGQQCLTAGDGECARREFDSAIEEFLQSGLDLRSNERLLAAWREMIEKINRYETSPLTATGKQLWRSQDFEGRPAQDPASEVASEFDGPADASTFQRRFAELRKRFQDKYARDITLTGADHAEHRRLYGVGSAYDIRVRDLTREQVAFIIGTGSKLGLRIKDFSTWESVATHNARTLMLGRPLDTLATGIHLHIDRMALTKKSLVSVPVTTRRPGQGRRSNNR